MAPSMRAALFGLDHERVREPVEWGLATESLVAATMLATRESGVQVGFWREGNVACDAIALRAHGLSEFVEVKTGRPRNASRGIETAAKALRVPGWGAVLTREAADPKIVDVRSGIHIHRMSVALWLYAQRGAHGGTLRVKT